VTLCSRSYLSEKIDDPILGLYTYNASAPLGVQAGLRQQYKFGLYSYCAYISETQGTCSNHTVAAKFQPYEAILSDMMVNYSEITTFIISSSNSDFQNSQYLGSSSQGAYYLVLLGTICAALALFTLVGLLVSSVVLNNVFSQRPCQAYGGLFCFVVSRCAGQLPSACRCSNMDGCSKEGRINQ
jgi:hypothetical protein